MNASCQSRTSNARGCGKTSPGHTLPAHLRALLFLLVLCAGPAGCSFLKPAEPTARYYLLTPVAAAGPTTAASASLALGVGQVKLPAYLFNNLLAVRKGTNEVEYLPSAIWAERLGTGFQRVLAANLAIVLPADPIQLSAWQKEAVAAELYVTLEQFDVDADGQGVLIARWRILSPGGEKILNAGGCRLTRQGSKPGEGASGVVATLSALVGDLSDQLAQALRKTIPTGQKGAL
jgi:uncharacterized protein